MPRATLGCERPLSCFDFAYSSVSGWPRGARRSRKCQIALHEKIERVEGSRLAAECAKLDTKFEQSLADEGLGVDATTWPEF